MFTIIKTETRWSQDTGIRTRAMCSEATSLTLYAKVCVTAGVPRRGAWAARAAVESNLSDIQHRAGERREGKGGGLSLRFRLGLPKRQEFSMLLQGDKVVKQVCGGSENNGKCSH